MAVVHWWRWRLAGRSFDSAADRRIDGKLCRMWGRSQHLQAQAAGRPPSSPWQASANPTPQLTSIATTRHPPSSSSPSNAATPHGLPSCTRHQPSWRPKRLACTISPVRFPPSKTPQLANFSPPNDPPALHAVAFVSSRASSSLTSSSLSFSLQTSRTPPTTPSPTTSTPSSSSSPTSSPTCASRSATRASPSPPPASCGTTSWASRAPRRTRPSPSPSTPSSMAP